jgi:hypothetical protein
MKTHQSHLRLLALVFMVTLACVSCCTKTSTSTTTGAMESTQPSCQRTGASGAMESGQPSGMVLEQTTWTDTVQAVDCTNRTVTLLHADGTTSIYQMGEDVRNFDQIHVGDTVKTTLTDSIALSVRESNEPPSATETTTIVRAPKGAKPGASITNVIDFNGKITAVDQTNRTVTVQGISGAPRTYQLGPQVNMSRLKVGHDVVGKYEQILTIQVEKP